MAIDIGRVAYTAFCMTFWKVPFRGHELPAWEKLDQVSQDAWRHAACAVLQYIDTERENLDKDIVG
jgi:hypothetical protein